MRTRKGTKGEKEEKQVNWANVRECIDDYKWTTTRDDHGVQGIRQPFPSPYWGRLYRFVAIGRRRMREILQVYTITRAAIETDHAVNQVRPFWRPEIYSYPWG